MLKLKLISKTVIVCFTAIGLLFLSSICKGLSLGNGSLDGSNVSTSPVGRPEVTNGPPPSVPFPKTNPFNTGNDNKKNFNFLTEKQFKPVKNFEESLSEQIQPLFENKISSLVGNAKIDEINYESNKLNIQLTNPLEKINIKGNTYGGLQVKEIEISYDAETDALKIEGKDIKGKKQFENIVYGKKKMGVITKRKGEGNLEKKKVDRITEVLKVYSNKDSNKEKNKQESKVEKIVLFHKDKEGKEKKLVFTSDKGKMIKSASVTDSSGEIQYNLASSEISEVNLRNINSTFGTSTDSLLTTTTDPLLQSTNISSESIGASSNLSSGNSSSESDLLSGTTLSTASLSDSTLTDSSISTSGPNIQIQNKINIDVLEEIKKEMDKKAAENSGKKILVLVGQIENMKNNEKIQYKAITNNPNNKDSITITLSNSAKYEIQQKEGKKTVLKTSRITLVEDKNGLSTSIVHLDTNDSTSGILLATSLERKKKNFTIEELEEIKSRILRKTGMKILLSSEEIKIPSRAESEIQNAIENKVQALNIPGSEKLIIRLDNNKDNGLLTVKVGNKIIKFNREGKIISSL